jgi:hypothetical protein
MELETSPLPIEECKRRALACGQTVGTGELRRASFFAEAIWPGHPMKPQGAGAAASRILKLLEREGRAGWRCVYDRASSRGRRWGWWAR